MLWWQTMERLEANYGVALDAEVLPESARHTWSQKTVCDRLDDAYSKWESSTRGLIAKPERTLRTSRYVRTAVPDPVVRELVLMLHWELRAHNDPGPTDVPYVKFARKLQEAKKDLLRAGYPDIPGASLAERRDKLDNYHAKGLLAELPCRDESDLRLLDRSPDRVSEDLDLWGAGPVEAIRRSGKQGRQFVESNIDQLFSQRFASYVPVVRDHGSSDEADPEDHDAVLGRGDPLHPDSTRSLMPDEAIGDEAFAVDLAEGVRRRMSAGEHFDDALTSVLRQAFGWQEGARLAKAVREDVAALVRDES